jgi:exonuclease III
MKIISWNCGGWSCGGFSDDRLNIVLKNKPDIIIIQECTEKEFNNIEYQCKFKHWYGDKQEKSYKGISIFSNINSIKPYEIFNDQYRYVVPYEISNVIDTKIILLSIWTKKPLDGTNNYQKTIFDALKYYEFKYPLIIIGDFNTGSNANHRDRYNELCEKLGDFDLKNCTTDTKYEYEYTSYHDRQKKYYTNDYCFLSAQFKLNYINIPNINEWKEIGENIMRWQGLSDHCPIEVDIKNEYAFPILEPVQNLYKRVVHTHDLSGLFPILGMDMPVLAENSAGVMQSRASCGR